MDMSNIPFGTTDWAGVTPTAHAGSTGVAHWRTRERSEEHTSELQSH